MPVNIPGIEEFLHIKLLDEELTGQDLQDLIEEQDRLKGKPTKQYQTSQHVSQGLNYGLPKKQNLIFKKHYNWSSPFMISEVNSFTL